MPPVAAAVAETYNIVLCVHSLPEHNDVIVMLDREALYDKCHRNLDIEPSFPTII